MLGIVLSTEYSIDQVGTVGSSNGTYSVYI